MLNYKQMHWQNETKFQKIKIRIMKGLPKSLVTDLKRDWYFFQPATINMHMQ